MMMEHRKYNSIENSYREKSLDRIRTRISPTEKWVVQEKIHGANLQVITDGQTVKFGSRNLMLNTEEDLIAFNRLDSIAENLSFSATDLYSLMNAYSYVMTGMPITIYGELCGGDYPHVEVAPVDTPKVQKGVHYAPDLLFYAFDIYVGDEETGHYLSSDAFQDLASKYFNVTKVLLEGTLDECLAYPNDGESTIPAELGLPIIEDNIMEGVVIKPSSNAVERMPLKNKNDKFAERSSSKGPQKAPEPVSDNLQKALDVIAGYINENRLDAVLSKHGMPLEGKIIGQTIGDLTKDALKDMEDDDNETLEVLDKSERKNLNKYASQISRKLILSKI